MDCGSQHPRRLSEINTEWPVWPIGYDRSDGMWLLRLDYKRHGFCLGLSGITCQMLCHGDTRGALCTQDHPVKSWRLLPAVICVNHLGVDPPGQVKPSDNYSLGLYLDCNLRPKWNHPDKSGPYGVINVCCFKLLNFGVIVRQQQNTNILFDIDHWVYKVFYILL